MISTQAGIRGHRPVSRVAGGGGDGTQLVLRVSNRVSAGIPGRLVTPRLLRDRGVEEVVLSRNARLCRH